MTNTLVVITNSLKVPNVKKILLYEMKFLVPNYSCLQNPWPGGLPLPDPRSLCPVLNWICWPPREQNFWVRHCIYEKVSPRQQTHAAGSQMPQHRPLSHDTVHCTHTVTWHCTLHWHCKLHWVFICSHKVPQSLGVCLVTFVNQTARNTQNSWHESLQSY